MFKFNLYFIIIMIDSLSYALIMPIMPDLLMQLGSVSISQAALYSGVLSGVFATLHFVLSPILGRLSDKFGRRYIILFSLFVVLFDYVCKCLAQSLYLLFIGRIICGLGLATLPTAQAAIDDTYAPKDKAAQFAMLCCALGVGFIMGSLISSTLSSFGPRDFCYLATILALGNLIFAYCCFEETLSINVLETKKYATSFKITLKLWPMLLVIFLYELAFVVYVATWSFFTKLKFGWDVSKIGLSLGLFGILAALMQGVIIRFLLARLGEYKTAALALLSATSAFVLYAQASQPWMIFAILPLTALGTLFLPASQSLLSNLVCKDSFGELQGIVVSVRAISLILGPPLMSYIFHLFFPSAVFIFAALTSLLSLVVFLSQQHKYCCKSQRYS